MKLNKLAILFAGLFALSTTLAFAKHGELHEGEPRESEHHSAERGAKADADGDGKMSYEEYRASKEKKSERQFKKMDTNGDGYIDAAEKQAQKDKMKAMRDKRKQKAQ